MSIALKRKEDDFCSDCKQSREHQFQSKINLIAHECYENTLAAACANRWNLSGSLACSLSEDHQKCRSVDRVLIQIQSSDRKKQLKQNKSLKAMDASNKAMDASSKAMNGGRKKSASNKMNSNMVRRLQLNPGKQCVPLQVKAAERQQLIGERNIFEENFPVGYYIAKAIEQLTKPGPSLRQAPVAAKINQITGEVGKRVMIKYSKQQVATTIDPTKYIRRQLNFDSHIKKSAAQKSQDSHEAGCFPVEIETQEAKNSEPERVQSQSLSQQVPLSEISLSNTPQNPLSLAFSECNQFGSPCKIRNRIHVTNQQELDKLISIRTKKNVCLLQRKYLRVNLQVNGPLQLNGPCQGSKGRPRYRSSLLFKFVPEK